MVDNVDIQKRSAIMRSIKGLNTKPEMIVRRYLFSKGFRYRLHDKFLPGKPDIKLTKFNTLIFVNGCFWHGHKDCKIYVMPKTNNEFWYSKIENNVERDKKNMELLKILGWKIIVIWECELKMKNRELTMKNLVDRILN